MSGLTYGIGIATDLSMDAAAAGGPFDLNGSAAPTNAAASASPAIGPSTAGPGLLLEHTAAASMVDRLLYTLSSWSPNARAAACAKSKRKSDAA